MGKNYVFPKVELPKVGRSNHNLDKAIMFSFSPGTARPIWSRDVLPKDHWEISFNASIESLPMLAPLYGSFKATWAFYFEPWSNIYGWMDNNIRQSTQQIIKQNLLRYTLPVMSYERFDDPEAVVKNYHVGVSNRVFNFDTTVNAFGVAPSSVWEDLGWPTGFNFEVVDVGPHNYFSVDDLEFENEGDTAKIVANGLYLNNVNAENFAQSVVGNIPKTYKLAPVYLHAVKPLAYLDIIRNYYVNNQMAVAQYIGVDLAYVNFGKPRPVVRSVSLEVLDYIFMLLRSVYSTQYAQHIDTWQELYTWFDSVAPLNNQETLHSDAVAFLKHWQESFCVADGGCFLTNYQMDLNRGLLATSTGNYKSTVDTSGGSFSIDTLRMQNKIQQLIDILDVTGGRFGDWVRALWSVDIPHNVDKPIYLGSISETISTTDIVSPSTTSGSVAGSQTGFAAGGAKGRKISFNSDIYGTIMCVFSYTPIVLYSSVFKREDVKGSFYGIYNPRMSQLGYQDVPRMFLSAEQAKHSYLDDAGKSRIYGISLADNGSSTRRDVQLPYTSDIPLNGLVGKQVAWAEYMSDIDESRGIFANNQSLEYWVLNRDYFMRDNLETFNNTLQVHNLFNGSTYIDPWKFQHLFADTEPNAQNFRQFIKFDVFVKRAIPKRTLGRL